MIRGILFDMDGVLFDTERLAADVSNAVGEQMGFPISHELILGICGLSKASGQERLREALGADFPLEEYYQRFERMMEERTNESLPQKPGVKRTLGFLRKNGFRIAIASSSSLDVIRRYLHLSGLAEYFDVLVSGDMVAQSKPHPDIFLLAAQRLGLPAHHCMAIEDSRNGIFSAASAGCHVIMIPDLIAPDEELRTKCASVLRSLRELPLFLQSFADPAPPRLDMYHVGTEFLCQKLVQKSSAL